MKLDLTYTISKALLSLKPAIDIHAKITSSDSDVDCCLFMILKLPRNFQNEYDYRFSHVADLVDMEDYPTYKDLDIAYYRTDLIVLRVRSLFLALQVIHALKSLVKLYVRACKLILQAPQLILTISFS